MPQKSPVWFAIAAICLIYTATVNYHRFVIKNNHDTRDQIPPTYRRHFTQAWRAAGIDLDRSVPSVDELYDRLVLLLAFSSNHFNESMGFIGSAQKYMPGKRIIVYDLGLTEEEKYNVSQLCDVEVRRFPFEDFPPHVKKLHSYAFKPILINLALREFGAIYYGDASVRFKKSLKELLPGIERHHGYMVNVLGFDATVNRPGMVHHYQLTVPEMFTKLGVDREEYFNNRNCTPHVQPGSQLIINSATVQNKVIQPWLQCALVEECITPKGSSRKNHRQDASALTLIVYKNLYGEWKIGDNDTKRLQTATVVRRHSDGFKENPHGC